jgi:hypothetical protein
MAGDVTWLSQIELGAPTTPGMTTYGLGEIAPTPAGDDFHVHLVPAGNLQSREESRQIQYPGEEEGTTIGM